MLGIDLGTKNLAIYSPYYQEIFSKRENITDLANQIRKYVENEICFVDFSWRINYWPGDRKTKTEIIFLAGFIWTVSKECYFIEPKILREYFDINSKTSKPKFHKLMEGIYPEIKSFSNSHIIDAFLLYQMGRDLK